MKATASDSDLLRRSGEGDQSAFTEFMERHAASVHRFLLSLGAFPDDAEDVLQDCFLAAWRFADTYRGSGSARGWLFSVARNGLRRQHRRRVGEPDALESLESLEALGERAGWGASTDFTARFEAEEELRWALAQLPEAEREVVTVRDLECLTGEETARSLGLSVSAMKSRLHRGRLRLMSVLRSTEQDHA